MSQPLTEAAVGQEAADGTTPTPAIGGGARSLRAMAVRGSVWTMAGFGLSQVIRLGGSMVTTRLLYPEAFGLMALVGLLMQGLVMFSDVGVGSCLVRSDRGDDERFLNTAWTIQVMRGLVLWAAAVALTWPMAWFYEEPALLTLVPIASLTAVISGFEPTKIHGCRRHLRLGKLTAVDLATQVISVVVMIGWAWLYPTVWALVGGTLLSGAARVVMAMVALDGPRNWFGWDRESRIELLDFGKWIFFSSAAFFIGTQMDRLLLGKTVGPGMLGVYSLAVMMSALFVDLNRRLARNVVYSAVSRIFRQQPHRLGEVYARASGVMGLMFLPALGMMMTSGAWSIWLLYDPRYAEAGWIFELLCFGAAMRCMLEPMEQCLVAVGVPRYSLGQNLLRLGWVGVGVPVGWIVGGTIGVVWAVATCEFPTMVLFYWGMARRGMLSGWHEARSWSMVLGGAAAGCGVYWVLSGVMR
ncbi:MAG: oligosaccharide flippase family protein [Phycisphaeraceae bacterium]|nr:oligosaccharide flippase family protein [Phycisphaeraceae bacterium]